jgi:hypothetical protein
MVTRFRDELHVVEYRSVISVFEGGPNALLGYWRTLESDRVRPFNGSAAYGRDKARAEEDGEDAEVLRRVHYANVAVS